MNFGTVSLAAPQAASSRVSRYSRTERRVLALTSQSTSSDPAAERCLLASAAIRLASTAKAAPSTSPSAMQRRTTISNSFRSRSQSRKRPCLFLENVLGERRVVRHLAVEPEPTEPTVAEVQVNLLAQPPFGTNAVAIANQQHPDQQFRINRRPASRAVKRRQVAANV